MKKDQLVIENKTVFVEKLKSLIWMARRYADKRMTYAVSEFNDSYDYFRDLLGNDLQDVGEDELCELFPYAQDGQESFNDVHRKRKYFNK